MSYIPLSELPILESEVQKADGNISWVYEQGQGIFSADGVILCLDGAIFDITKRKLSEEEQQKLIAVVENSNDFRRDRLL